MIGESARHPLPRVITTVSALMVAGAAWAGLHGITRPASASAGPVAERPLSRPMIGVAGESALSFDKQTGIRASLAVFYLSMSKPVPGTLRWMQATANGARPVIEIIPHGGSLAPVTAGRDDTWLGALAAQIRQLNEPVVVAFAPEANGTWYPWGSQPAKFRAAWRHVHSVVGTHDITWMWQMSSRDPVAGYWPGARYVQWVGIDGYFRTPPNTFRSLFDRTLNAVGRITSDPVLLSETAVGPLTRQQPTDITRLFLGAISRHLIAVVWFDVAQSGHPNHQDWRLRPGSAAMAAFRNAARAYLLDATA